MRESLLHLVWLEQLFDSLELKTTKGKSLIIHQTGFLNDLQGPDFKNALLEISNQKWAGNVEIHIKSSDWYAHQHQKDKNYRNVLLHVVYEYDVEVFDVHGNEIPTLELKGYIPKEVLQNYKQLMGAKNKWIFCEEHLKEVDVFKWNNWLERLYVERLERKVNEIEELFDKTGKDWEATLFLMLAKSFGGNLNGTIFLEAFSQVDFGTIRKQIVNKTTDSFLFGLVGLLNEEGREEVYYKKLKKEFTYQKQKHQLKDLLLPELNFYGCRPSNFPTIRLAQLVAFYEKNKTVFTTILKLESNIESYKDLFKINVSEYWQMHYNFEKPSKTSPKSISKGFIDLLLMNVIIPVLFFYHKTKGEKHESLLELMYEIDPEKNNIISKFSILGHKANSALQTQALLRLKKEYCDKERCAECQIGVSLIR